MPTKLPCAVSRVFQSSAHATHWQSGVITLHDNAERDGEAPENRRGIVPDGFLEGHLLLGRLCGDGALPVGEVLGGVVIVAVLKLRRAVKLLVQIRVAYGRVPSGRDLGHSGWCSTRGGVCFEGGEAGSCCCSTDADLQIPII